MQTLQRHRNNRRNYQLHARKLRSKQRTVEPARRRTWSMGSYAPDVIWSASGKRVQHCVLDLVNTAMTSSIVLTIQKSLNTSTRAARRAIWKWWSFKRGCQNRRISGNISKTDGCAASKACKERTHQAWTKAWRMANPCIRASARCTVFSRHLLQYYVRSSTSRRLYDVKSLSFFLLSSTSMTSKTVYIQRSV